MTRSTHLPGDARRPPRGALALIGLALIAGAGVWRVWYSGRVDERLPSGARWSVEFVGATALPDPETGAFPPRDTAMIYTRSIRIVDESRRPREVTVEDAYRIADPVTGAPSWEYISLERVDPATGERLEPEYRGQCAVFPRWVERRDFVLSANYMKAVPVRYTGEEDVEHLRTYVFSYRGPAEYTESYAGSPSYPGVPVEPGQEIRCADDQYALRLWVEPVTGEIVKLQESCAPGDFIVDRATGARIAPVLRWSGQTAGDDVEARAASIAAERSRILWLRRYGPLTAALAGIGFLALSFVPRRQRDLAPAIPEVI